ncbi:hypothetical protein B566_EDAN015295, partial [Ephemera danica]
IENNESPNEEEDSFVSFTIDHDESPLASSPIEDPLDEEYLESCMEPELVTIHVNDEESSILHSMIVELEKKQQYLEEALENSIEIDIEISTNLEKKGDAPPGDIETTEEGHREEKIDKNCRRCQIVKCHNLYDYLHYVYSCDMEQLLKTVKNIKFLKRPFISQLNQK